MVSEVVASVLQRCTTKQSTSCDHTIVA